MESINCVVERVTYQNEQNGYSVLKCKVKSYDDLVPVVGHFSQVFVGTVLKVTGFWRLDAQYGRQFTAVEYEETMPATAYGIEKYLASGMIKGVGPVIAKRIVEMYGEETLDILDNHPEKLKKVNGIGKKMLEKIKTSWAEQKEIKNIMIFLKDHDVSTVHATKIFKTYRNDSIDIVKKNPYQLAEDIWGIGFKTADTIALKMGFEHDAKPRVKSGILYTLNRLADDGHCYAKRDQLIDTAKELLEVDGPVISDALNEMIEKESVKVDHYFTEEEQAADAAVSEANSVLTVDGKYPSTRKMDSNDEYPGLIGWMDETKEPTESGTCSESAEPAETSTAETGTVQISHEAIYLPAFYYAEIGVAGRLKAIARTPSQLSIQLQGLSDRIQAATGMVYDDIQMQAIETALVNKVMILTGGPGTGKTTTVLGIIKAFEQTGATILLAAPTGRAAKRMSEATGREAKTIHRLLDYKPPAGYSRNDKNPLEGDVLIVDESSMIDLMLMNALLKAVPDTMHLILVGDVDQLPSVGAGNVLGDILEAIPAESENNANTATLCAGSGGACSVRLTRIFRQAAGSRIITNAHKINRGEYIDLSGGKNSDFFFAPSTEPEQTAEMIVHFVAENLPKYYSVDRIRDIQVLTPMRRGIVGADALNEKLQEALNPNQLCLKRGGTEYRLNDKVMQIKNDYDKEVFNGDIGLISSVDQTERELTVNFDGREVTYDISELDELVLAYATTIHKSQGSEYPIVVMPMTMKHFGMLVRNLLYTGVTRAKKICLLVGEKKAINMAIKNYRAVERNTMLAERIKIAGL